MLLYFAYSKSKYLLQLWSGWRLQYSIYINNILNRQCDGMDFVVLQVSLISFKLNS
jgi:hypothetical protein